MPSYAPFIWKQAPFIRLLPPLIAGIIFQYYLPLPVIASWRLTGISLCGLTLYSLFTPYTRFTLQWLTGVYLHLLLFSAGALLTYYKDSSPLAQKVALFCKTDEYHTAGFPSYSSYPFLTGSVIASAQNRHAPRLPSSQPLTSPVIASAPRWRPPEIIAAILENPSEKKSSWKTLAEIKTVHKKHALSSSGNQSSPIAKDQSAPTNHNAPGRPERTAKSQNSSSLHHTGCSMTNCGKIIVYFLKQDHPPKHTTTPAYPRYGNIISFSKPLQLIKNFMPPGPGSFDYRRYCAFAGIHFQVFLRPGEFTILPGTHSTPLQALLIHTREWIISTIQKYIPGKKEQGLAEALLIGYKDDLDKSLLQSYSNTGVVHVIAISGLHLGLIYALLKTICLPISRQKKGRWLEPLIILTGLWLFSLLAGGAPSVLRSAVMFSFIVLGKSISRETSIYNNLAASAFALLCYHPYWLWDVGFQLSYAALTGIVIFMKPVYRLLTFKNTIADAAWKLHAVTIAAQWLTLPLILFYFHQFPNLFILTNFIAVPLSSIILMGELLLCGVSWLNPVATAIGWVLHWMIWLMNTSIQYLEKIPFSTWKDLTISLPQVILFYVIIFCASNLLSKINTHK